jgi:hypothetical protein
MLLVNEIRSGGQTGADMAGLIAAQSLGIKTGGVAPLGFRTENGSNPELGSIYGLTEHESDKYPPRTMQNIDDSDGTIAFLFRDSVGTKYTIGYCHTHEWTFRSTSKDNGYRPVLVIKKITSKTTESIQQFLLDNSIKILNIAGNRESSYQGIQDIVVKILIEALSKR